MKYNLISLPEIVSGREYIINYIDNGKTDVTQLYGYGIFPGSKIKLLFKSPAQNPSAYEVMGAVLALRDEDSAKIYVTPELPLQEEQPLPKP